MLKGRKMLKSCDYVLDDEGRFHIVRGYWNQDDVLVNTVWAPSSVGTRFNGITSRNYAKVIDENIIPRRISSIKNSFDPRTKLAEDYEKIKGTLWGNFVDLFVESGIPFEDIGIIGSYLIGFGIEKDVDFVVYGKENCKKLKQNMDKIKKSLNATSISESHIDYQIKKHGKDFAKLNTFNKLLCNKWSSIQIKDGLLSTVRFVYKPEEIPENFWERKKIRDVEITAVVTDDLGSNFCPRSFQLEVDGQKYTVATYFWIYQSCARNGMKVAIKGTLREGDIITLDSFEHWISVL